MSEKKKKAVVARKRASGMTLRIAVQRYTQIGDKHRYYEVPRSAYRLDPESAAEAKEIIRRLHEFLSQL